MSGIIKKISGPLVVAEDLKECNMFDVVKVSDAGLIGEAIEIHGDNVSIQVYEETTGLAVGESVSTTNQPLSVELGPGLIGSIFDGIQRPLDEIMKKSGNNLHRGISVSPLSTDKKWDFTPCVKVGAKVSCNDVIGTVQETEVVIHKILVPYGVEGTVLSVKKGEYTINDTVAVIKCNNGQEFNITLKQKWPVRKGRPYIKKLSPDIPLITGQRVIDTFFPIAKGGVAAVPGPFGSGKTIVQHQLAKWADADIVVYIGCGERGNEMTDVLNEFPELIDPKTGYSLMKRTVLIANTSDMPVAAREASIYTGITIAEYYRDMGYSVAIMADSTSRWAEALREMSGRLEEMPGEEGYPAYLSSRLAQFYERAGRVIVNKNNTEGSLTIIGAVSPPGGDISEPVTQATLRIVKAFWSLDSNLAYKRHFPAVSPYNSYSLYKDNIDRWLINNISPQWDKLRDALVLLLHEESELEEVVKLVGQDSLSPVDKLKLEAARSVREDYLHQNAFHDVDTFTPLDKQYLMMKVIVYLYHEAEKVIKKGVKTEDILSISAIEKIGRLKYSKNYQEESDNIIKTIDKELCQCLKNTEQ